jgi:Co/Zn/Cd efflux system component
MLLDRQAPNAILDSVRKAVETDDRFRVADLHIWSIGPGYRAAIIAVSATAPCTIEDVRAAVPKDIGDE